MFSEDESASGRINSKILRHCLSLQKLAVRFFVEKLFQSVEAIENLKNGLPYIIIRRICVNAVRYASE